MSKKMTAKDVRKALRGRHPENEGAWVCLEEWELIDFLAISVWQGQTRGCRNPWIAYEIKVSRSDFTRELKRPEKRAAAVALANQFYFAVPSGLVKASEVPEDCGLLYVTGAGTRVIREAPVSESQNWRGFEFDPSARRWIGQMLRHGMRPGWLRSMQTKRAALRWREDQANETVKRHRAELDRVYRLLERRLIHTVEAGQRWTAIDGRTHWSGRLVEVLEITGGTSPTIKLRFVDGEHGLVRANREYQWTYEPRLPLGEFLASFELQKVRAVA